MEQITQLLGALLSIVAASIAGWYYVRLLRKNKSSQVNEGVYLTSAKESLPDRALNYFVEAMPLRYQGKFFEADRLLDQSLEILNDLKEGHSFYTLRISDIYAVKGDIRLALGQPEEAMKMYELAKSCLPEWNNKLDLETKHRHVQSKWALARLYLENDPQKAISLLSEAQTILEKIRNSTQPESSQYLNAAFGLAVVNNLYGRLALIQGDLTKAKKHFTQSLRNAEVAQHFHSLAQALLGISILKFEQGNYIDAIEFAEKAKGVANKNGFNEPRALSNLVLGKTNIQLGEFSKASIALSQACVIAGNYSPILLDKILDEIRASLIDLDTDAKASIISQIKNSWRADKKLVMKFGELILE